MAKFEKCYKVEKQLSKQEFFRAVLIGLTLDESTPFDILSSKFKDVTEYEEEAIVLGAQVTVHYSCAVGYDRQEDYIDYEEYIDYDDGRKKKRRQVIKTRTVTDWQPYQTVETHNALGFAYNRELGCEDSSMEGFWDRHLLADAYPYIREKMVETDNGVTVSGVGRNIARSHAESVAASMVNIPGDRFKNDSATYETIEKELNCVTVPCYEIKFNYENKSYRAYGLGVGQPRCIFNDKPKSETPIEEIAKNATKAFGLASLILLILSPVSCVGGGVLDVVLGVITGTTLGWVWGIGFALFIGFFTVAHFISVARKKKMKKIASEIKAKKIETLNETLVKYHLPQVDPSDYDAWISKESNK